MDNLQALNLIVGFLAPTLISVINRPTWDSRLKVAVSVAFCVAVGFGTSYFSDQLNPEDVTTSVLTILVASITSYHGIFKPSGVSPAIEMKTSPERKLYKDDQSG